ncbi:MAG TPA: hypothetical protein VGD00_09965, partial [Solirubrobacteraceae bacterium]
MPEKAVVVVPTTTPFSGPWLGATRATSLQRVANRAIVCHVLDALAESGVREAVVLSPTEVLAEVVAVVDREGPSELAILHVPYDEDVGGRDVLAAASEFIEDDACLLHRGDGMLGEPLQTLVEPRPSDLDVLLLVCEQPNRARPLQLVPGIGSAAGIGEAGTRGVFAGVCVLGPGVMTELVA